MSHPPPDPMRELRLRLVVVADAPDARDMYALYLQHLGIRAVTATDGLAAIALVKAERADAIVLDLSLPGLDGLETICRLRKDDATRDLPIIVVSGTGTGASPRSKRARTASC